ncbi:MAG TPA: glycosyltransferase family 39 protein [Candidatus Nanoarchaeia archaeon]|nr:glycosyltransferase family 39 protein [Candidatus Nanoarchaeia archaeon]
MISKERAVRFLKDYYAVAFLVLLVIAGAIYFRLAFVDSIWLDETSYIWHGQLLHQDPSFILDVGFYHLPYSLVALYDFFFSSFIAGRLMGLTFGLGGIILVFLIGRRLRNSFVGLVAALLLAFNVWYMFLSLKALVDVAISVMILLFAYLLYLTERERKWWQVALLAVVGGLTLTTKASGVFVIPLTMIYLAITYLLFTTNKKEQLVRVMHWIRTTKGRVIAGVGVIGIVVVVFLFRRIIDFLFGISLAWVRNFSFRFIWPIFEQLPTLVGWLGIMIGVVAILFAVVYRTKEAIVITLTPILFLVLAIFFSGRVPELRYMLPIVPPVFIMVGYVTDETIRIISMFIKEKAAHIQATLRIIILIVLFFAIVEPEYSIATQNIEMRNYFYRGYIEAMNWVSENVPATDEHYISNFFACCGYNVGLESDKVLRVNSTATFDAYEDFTAFLEREPNMTVYLMPDMWETGQRSWLYPMTQEKFDTITSLGFQPVYVVERPYPTNEGLRNISVIFIFRKN